MNVFESILHDIKQSRLLQEDIDTVKKYYPEIPDDVFMQIISLDPTFRGNNSVGTYGKWLLNLYKKGALVEDEFKFVTDALEMFTKVKKVLPNKDIQQYKKFDDLVQALSEVDEETYVSLLTPAQRTKYLKSIKAGRIHVKEEDDYEVAYEDSDWIVCVPHTHAASMKLGKGTEWCTAHENPEWWEHYTSNNGKLYIFKNKHSGNRYQYSSQTDDFLDDSDSQFNLYDTFYLDSDVYKFLNSLNPDKFPIIDLDDGVLTTDCSIKPPRDLESVVVEVYIKDGVEEIPKEMFSYFSELDTVHIPDSVVRIGDGAFEGCSSLTDIKLPSNLQVIGLRAFNSTGLGHINIPSSVASIHTQAFSNSDLKGVVINSNDLVVYEAAFSYCDKLLSVKFNVDDSAIIDLGDNAFRNCTSLTTIELPKGCTIHDSTFTDCVKLKSVVFDGSEIGPFAFRDCEQLKNISLGDGINKISAAAFYNCSALETIDLPNSVKAIGSHAFCGCNALKQISVPNGVTMIPNNAFERCYVLKTVDIPESVQIIGYRAFASCTSLESVQLPDGLKAIHNAAFVACKNIKEIIVPDSVTEIGASAFMGTGIEHIKLSNNLDVVSENLFGGCKSLKSVVIPKSVTHFGDTPFVGCTALETVTILSDDATCSSMTFDMLFDEPTFVVKTNAPKIIEACKKAGVKCVRLTTESFRLNIKE